MTDQLPARVPSLTAAFEAERAALLKTLHPDLSASQIVSEARRALDRTGAVFVQDVSDPAIHKSGLWLLEVVKAGAGVLDRGTEAEVMWREVTRPKARKWVGRGLFYGAATAFGLVGYMQNSGLVMLTASALAIIRFFDPRDWEVWFSRLPMIKKPVALEDSAGRKHMAQARITADSHGFVDSLTDALKTADHILARLAEPQLETHWRDDPRLMGLIQSLLEAGTAQDGHFALKLIESELEAVLAAEGIEIITYAPKHKAAFDALPMLGAEAGELNPKDVKPAAPALRADGRIIRRGTVWTPQS